MKLGRHLIWEDGYCDQNPGMPRSKVSELLLKEQGVIKSTDSFLELGCQADDGLGVLVHKIMASQVHVVGDGCVDLHLVILGFGFFFSLNFVFFEVAMVFSVFFEGYLMDFFISG